MWRTELLVSTPVAALMGSALLASVPLCGRSIWWELWETLIAAALFGALGWIFVARRERQRIQRAAELGPDAVRETQGRTLRCEVMYLVVVTALFAFLSSVFEGDIGALAGLMIGGAVVLGVVLRRVVRWERTNNAVLFRERALRSNGRLFWQSQRPPPVCP